MSASPVFDVLDKADRENTGDANGGDPSEKCGIERERANTRILKANDLNYYWLLGHLELFIQSRILETSVME